MYQEILVKVAKMPQKLLGKQAQMYPMKFNLSA